VILFLLARACDAFREEWRTRASKIFDELLVICFQELCHMEILIFTTNYRSQVTMGESVESARVDQRFSQSSAGFGMASYDMSIGNGGDPITTVCFGGRHFV
jgi:hypothetical protein